ncbi:MAG: hypothetical protein B6243_07680 [Anaerolineaceae bacterium 4572_5.2]|nr:MAG: hypothetical protein B6243_07680 [Anaerolineaceae bacterium 4572_5.2]
MTIPSVLLGFLIASFYGALFHLWRGGGAGRLFLYLALAWLGFFGGHFLAAWSGWIIFSVGPLNLVMATLGAILVLLLGHWLSLLEIQGK